MANRKYVLWGGIFLVAALVMAAQVGFWNHVTHVQLQDVTSYENWSDYIVQNHAPPTENTWQHPSGAAFLMLIPRLGGNFGRSLVGLMLIFDLLAALVWRLGRRRRDDQGLADPPALR